MAAGGSAIEVNTYNVDGSRRLPHRDPKQTTTGLRNGLKAALHGVIGRIGFDTKRLSDRPFDPIEPKAAFGDA
jgi:hypothetical protein